MLRYINSVATIEQNSKINAIEVNFKGYGVKTEYDMTLDMAVELATLQQVGSYLLVKEHFEDMDVQTFCNCLHRWLRRLDAHFNRSRGAKSKVALLVSRTFYLKLSEVMHKNQLFSSTSLYHVSFEMFYVADKAKLFLHKELASVSQHRRAIPLQTHRFVFDKKL